MKKSITSLTAAGLARAALIPALGLALLAPSTHAIQIKNGGLTGSFDSTISFGAIYRLRNLLLHLPHQQSLQRAQNQL